MSVKTQKSIFCFSIHITGRCDSSCTYCHYYGQRDKKSIWKDLDKNLYQTYLQFIEYWSKTVPGKTILRFSGGDPLILRDKLCSIINQAYKTTNIKPYILTAGKSLTEVWVKKAKRTSLSHIFVSLENPLNPDRGAPDPCIIMKKITSFNSKELPILPGTMIIRNEDYKDLFRICQIVYNQIGAIPNFSELNYQAYQSPNQKELDYLYENVYQIVLKYANKYPINIFSYVAPELGYGNTYPYITDLNLSNTLKIKRGKFEKGINSVIRQLSHSSRKGDCKNYFCDWFDQCKIVKWMWYESYGRMSVDQKMKDYCRYKKVIMSAFYHALTHQSPSHWDKGLTYMSKERSKTPKNLITHGKIRSEINPQKFGVL